MLHCHNARTVRLFSWITTQCWNKDLRFSYRLTGEAPRHYFLFWTVQEFITLWWFIRLNGNCLGSEDQQQSTNYLLLVHSSLLFLVLSCYTVTQSCSLIPRTYVTSSLLCAKREGLETTDCFPILQKHWVSYWSLRISSKDSRVVKSWKTWQRRNLNSTISHVPLNFGFLSSFMLAFSN